MNKVMNNKRDSGSDRRGIAFASGMILILSVTLCYMTAVVAYMVGGGISAWSLPAATLMAAAVAALSLDLRDVAWALPGALAVWALWIVACMNLYDSSFDGVLYHMEIVAQLYSGWNPVMDTMGIFSTEPWAQHYAKGMEMAGACVMCLTDDIQSSKAVMPVLATGLLLLLPAWTARLRPGLGVRKRCILAFLTISNPVLICQMLRFYIDDAVYICIVLAIMSSLSLLSCGKRDISDLLILGAAIILAAATKPNALFFVALALGCIIAGAYVARRREGLLDLTIFCAVTVILAVCIFSYHPYITNWLIKGHPLYPLMGEGAVDIMTGHTDEMFSGHNRFYNFFRSIYTVARPTVAQGYGGFTPFFMILLPCSAAIIAICCIRRRCLGADGYAALCIFASCFIFPQSWWARYVPQVWLLVPLAVAMAYESPQQPRLLPPLRRITVALGLATGIFCSVTTYLGALRFTLRQDCIYEVMEGRTITVSAGQPQTVRMLGKHNIRCVEVPWNSLSDREKEHAADLLIAQDEWHKVMTESDQEELDSLLRSNNFYRFGVAIRRLMGKDDNIPFYN